MVEWSTQTFPDNPAKRPVSPSKTAWGVKPWNEKWMNLHSKDFTEIIKILELPSHVAALAMLWRRRLLPVVKNLWLKFSKCFMRPLCWKSFDSFNFLNVEGDLSKLLGIICWRWERCELRIPEVYVVSSYKIELPLL